MAANNNNAVVPIQPLIDYHVQVRNQVDGLTQQVTTVTVRSTNLQRSIGVRAHHRDRVRREARIEAQARSLYDRFERNILQHMVASNVLQRDAVVNLATATARWGRLNSRFGGADHLMRTLSVNKYRERVVTTWGLILTPAQLALIQTM